MFKPGDTTTATCKVCNSVYLRRADQINFCGKNEKVCVVCGEVIERWEGKRLPTFKLVKRGTLMPR
jgi:hypothetical protein